jgi:hypothetical protein
MRYVSTSFQQFSHADVYVQGYNSVYSTDSGEESERERTKKTTLGKLARKRFEAMLRSLSGKCGEIGRCMAFSLDHGEAAHEVRDFHPRLVCLLLSFRCIGGRHHRGILVGR